MDKTLLKKNGKTICWKNLTLNDAEEVEQLMVEYCRSEPLSAAINTEEMQLATLETAKTLLSKNISIGAFDIDNNDRLCSLCLVGLYDPINFQSDLDSAGKVSGALSAMIRFTLEILMGMKNITQGAKFLHHKFSVTAASYRRMGITTKLQERLVSVAKQQGCRYIAGVYSSEYTIKVAQNLGYKLLDEVIHNKYVDPITGKMPFQDMISHNYSKAMYYDVDLSNR